MRIKFRKALVHFSWIPWRGIACDRSYDVIIYWLKFAMLIAYKKAPADGR